MCSQRTEFDLSIHAEKDVIALDVAMDDAVPVQELKRLKDLHVSVKCERRLVILSNISKYFFETQSWRCNNDRTKIIIGC